MAEVLNEHFSSVFTTEDISSLPITVTKFEGNKSDHFGQLFVTSEMIAKKIKKMKNNKSPGVDGIYNQNCLRFNKIAIPNNKFQMAKWTRKPLAYREPNNFLIYV